MRSSGAEKLTADSAMLPPIKKSPTSSATPDSEDDDSEDFMPSIGVSGYRDLRKQTSRTSSPPSRLGSMYSSAAGSPTKLPTLDCGGSRYSVASLGSSRSLMPSTRGSLCRSPSCPQLYSDVDDVDSFPGMTGADFNASIHPHMTKKIGQTTVLRLPEIFNAAESVPKFKHQPTNGVKNLQWSKATPRSSNQISALNINQYQDGGAGLKRQTTSSVGSSIGSSPTKSDIEYSQCYHGGNALLLPLRETRRIRKKRKHGGKKTARGEMKDNNNSDQVNALSSSRKETDTSGNVASLGKWEANCDDYGSDGSTNSVDSDCDLTYDQDIAIDEIAMENKVKFGCMKSL